MRRKVERGTTRQLNEGGGEMDKTGKWEQEGGREVKKKETT